MSSTPGDLQRAFTGSIPSYYDRCLGPAWFGKIAEDLARRVPADPGGDVLEIACGTGLATRTLRERLDPRRRFVATDLNQSMLDVAMPKMADLAGISWRTADFARLPFEDESFAAVVCSLGVMFVPDRKGAFAQARRVLAPGGLFLFNVWDRAEENPCVRTYAEVIEGMFPGDKEMHFRLPFEMHDEGLLRGLLDGAGFTVRRLEKVRLPIEGVSAREIATGQIRGTPRGALLAQRGVDFDTAIDKVTAALEKVGGEGAAFRSHCQVIVVEALAG